MSDVDDLKARLIEAREAACSSAEVCAAQARIEHYNRQYAKGCHDVATLTCPDKRIPKAADLADWLPQCPAPVRKEAIDRLANLYKRHAFWAKSGWWLADEPLIAEVSEPMEVRFSKAIAAIALVGYEVFEDREVRTIADVHAAWVDLLATERPRHPLAPLIETWQRNTPEPVPLNERRHVNVPALLANTAYVQLRRHHDGQAELPFAADDLTPQPPDDKPRFQTAWLPGWEPSESKLVPCPLLDLWDSGASRGRRGPVPVAQRVGWELLLAPEPGDYIGRVADLRIKLGNLAGLVWPGTKYVTTRHGQQMRDAARWLNDPDNAVQWSTNAHDTPTNIVLWYNAPTKPFLRNAELGAYVTVPDGGLRRGAQIDNHLRRRLAAVSYRQHRVYMAACVLWDRRATYRGYLVQFTVPEVNRNPDGYIIGPDGKIVTEKDGSPSRRPTHRKAVHTDKRLPNPAAEDAYPWIEGEDAILLAHHRIDNTVKARNMQRVNTVKTIIELHDFPAGAVLDFEVRYRGEGCLSAAELAAMDKLPPGSELEAVRLLPTPVHFAAYEARRKERRKIEKARRRQRSG